MSNTERPAFKFCSANARLRHAGNPEGASIDPNITAREILDLIQKRAHQIWEEAGKPDGKDREHWLAAQKEIMEEVDRTGATGPDDPVAREPRSDHPKKRQDDLIDEGVEETFPASDPVSVKRIT